MAKNFANLARDIHLQFQKLTKPQTRHRNGIRDIISPTAEKQFNDSIRKKRHNSAKRKKKLYTSKMFFRNEREFKSFSDKGKLREFANSKTTLKE